MKPRILRFIIYFAWSEVAIPGRPLRTVSFDPHLGIVDVVGLFAPDTLLSFIVLRTGLGFMGAGVKRRNVGTMTLGGLESRKNRKTSIAGVRHS